MTLEEHKVQHNQLGISSGGGSMTGNEIVTAVNSGSTSQTINTNRLTDTFIKQDGSVSMTGDFNLGSNDITNVTQINGTTWSTLLSSINQVISDLSDHESDNTIHFTVGSIDHGSIANLLDDDHTQYALLAGRPGGQTLNGGTASGNNLTLTSTANATKGFIIFGSTSAYDELNDSLGIGTTTPASLGTGVKLGVVGNNETTKMLIHGGTGEAAIEIGNGGSGNRYAYMDLVGDDTYTDYGARLIRENTGSNALTVLRTRGTGGLNLVVEEAGPIGFYTNSNNRGGIASDGLWTIQKNAESLRIQSGGNGAHCYQSFYPDGSANSRHGWIGYGFDGDNNLTIRSEAGELSLYAPSANGIRAYASFGYATGTGGTVTQVTSKSTGVTLNTVCGEITTHNASLGANTTVSFTVTNSTVATTDTIIVHRDGGGTAASYIAWVDSVSTGSFVICLRNMTGSSLGEAVRLKFCVIKSVNS